MNRCRFATCLVSWLVAAAPLPALAANYTVAVGGSNGLSFDPATLTINAGDSVTWQWAGGLHAHNVVADGLFRCAIGCDDTGGNGAPSASPWTFTRKFSAPGTVDYYCFVHRDVGMIGTITVKPAAAVTIGPGFTGVWNDPKQARHGIFVEVLPPSSFLAWWFTFTPDGTQQSWFGGVGTYSGSTATVPVNLTTGGQWIPNFDVSKTKDNSWGTLTFTFTDCNTGRVDFASTYPGYGSNHMDLTRVTLPGGLTCP